MNLGPAFQEIHATMAPLIYPAVMKILPHRLPVPAAAFALSTLALPGILPALDVLSVSRQPAGAVDVSVPSAADHYYILWHNVAGLGSLGTAEAVKSGTGNSLMLTSAVSAAAKGFYRVQQEPLTSTLDLDGDTMPDSFELRYPAFLNPLNIADGANDFDGDGVSNEEEYVNGTDPSLPPGVTAGLVINEVDYDQVATDTSEFVEIYNQSAAAVSLSGLALVLINGASNTQYGTSVNLGPAGSLAPGEYLVVGSTTLLATVPASAKKIAFAGVSDQIQNGAPDGVAIINVAQSSLIDALSYEGSITAANITGFPGPVSLVEGTVLATAVADSNTVPGSLVRLPNGQDTDNANADWKFTSTPTPGVANAP